MPIAKVQLPDGRIARFEVPDGTSPDQVAAYAEKQFGDKQAKGEPGMLESFGMGALRGVKDVIDTGAQLLASGFDKVAGTKEGERVRTMNEAGKADFDAHYGKSTAADIGRVGGNIVATLPVGGVLGTGIKAAAPVVARVLPSAAPAVQAVGNAVAAGGIKAGQVAKDASIAAKTANMATRITGGAVAGGVSAGLVNPDDAGAGAVVGGMLPPALKGAGAAVKYAGNAVGSVVKPFLPAGQDEIAGRILREFAKGGPAAINAAEVVPGSVPTLAEASGNSGLATLQRAVRDVRPNAFTEREAANAAARTALFDNVAGNADQIAAAKIARDETADSLYGRSFQADSMRRELAKNAQDVRAPFAGVGLSGTAEDLSTPGLRALAQRPLFRQAIEDAKKLAANKGHQMEDPLQSLEGLHYIKLALDDMLNPATKSAMGRNASGAVSDMRDTLAAELAKISPLYGNARQTFAEMSGPINAMEALQALRLTDKKGDITLAKIKGAIEGLERMRRVPGVNAAKSVTDEQLASLRALHDDLLRAENVAKGKSINSNTFQNIATDNIISSVGGKWAGALAQKSGVSGLVGQVGKLAYSGPNEAIRNRLVDMMLNPAVAEEAMRRQESATAIQRLLEQLESSAVLQSGARAAPVLAAGQ